MSCILCVDRLLMRRAYWIIEYVPTTVGTSFGPSWSTHWFKVEVVVPTSEEWVDKEVHFVWDSCSEAMVWVDGAPVQVGRGCLL